MWTLAAVLVASSLAAPGRVVDFPTARVYAPFTRPARYKGAHGGRGSAKSHEFGKNVVQEHVRRPGTRTVCVREIQRTLDQSVKKLLEDKIKLYGVGDLFESTRSEIRSTGGGLIVFEGMQDHTAESIKSLEGFDRAWVEEAQTLSERSLRLLRPTIRTPGSELWFSWNPRYGPAHPKGQDPVDALLRGPNPPPDSIVIASSFRDNPWFPDVLRTELEYDLRRDPEMYAHVWEGGYEARNEARVFKNWRVDILPESGEMDSVAWLFGADWGYAVDPTTLFRGRLISPRTLYIDWELFRIGVEIDHIPDFFRQVPLSTEWPITADGARPDTISYLQRHGFPKMEAAKKGPDSVKEGIIFLQGLDIVLHPRCEHAIREFTRYSYKVDKVSGLVLPELADKENHIIDPVRYACERLHVGLEFASW